MQKRFQSTLVHSTVDTAQNKVLDVFDAFCVTEPISKIVFQKHFSRMHQILAVKNRSYVCNCKTCEIWFMVIYNYDFELTEHIVFPTVTANI